MAEAGPNESVFTWAAPPLKFGVGALDEIGADVAQLGAGSCLVITDAGVADSGIPERVRALVAAAGVKCEVFSGVAVEPTDVSIAEAVAYAREGDWDCFVAVGGGSSIDTAKAVNLLTTHDGDLLDYVVPPIGGGRAPDGPLKPLVAVPTTAGTGSESTTICVVDLLSQHLKAGISHARLRPSLAVVDPADHGVDAGAGDGRERHGRAQPRAGELHRAAFRRPTGAGRPDETPGLLRGQPGQRHLVRGGVAARRPAPARSRAQRP